MPDHLTKQQRSRLMSHVRPKNSKIELLVFSALQRNKIYFQKHYKNAPGTPDMARPSEKKAVFIHSDFWHGWQLPKWQHKLSKDYWREKITENRKRDQRKIRQLRSRGWKVMVIWEHSIKKNFEFTIKKLITFLKS